MYIQVNGISICSQYFASISAKLLCTAKSSWSMINGDKWINSDDDLIIIARQSLVVFQHVWIVSCKNEFHKI